MAHEPGPRFTHLLLLPLPALPEDWCKLMTWAAPGLQGGKS